MNESLVLELGFMNFLPLYKKVDIFIDLIQLLLILSNSRN